MHISSTGGKLLIHGNKNTRTIIFYAQKAPLEYVGWKCKFRIT